MRFWSRRLLLMVGLSFCASLSWGDTPLFRSFLEQRELVATVFFDHGSSRLDPAATAKLDSSLSRLRHSTCASRLIRIEGFSGQEGTAESAFRLSLNRAYSVARYLESRGVSCLVGVNGYGAPQASPPISAKSLRVEIAAYPKLSFFDFDNARRIDHHEVQRP